MSKNIFTIDLKLPSLNDYIRVCRANKYKAAKYKADIENDIALFINHLPRYEKPIKIHFHWIESNKKRDLDNVAFAKKFILDTLVKCGKLKDDNRRHVQGFTDSFCYGKKNKVVIEIEEIEPKVETPLYNSEKIYRNCTVQVWENTATGETSVGWFRNDEREE